MAAQGRGMDWEFGISRCKLVYLEWINNNVLLYSPGNYIQYPAINHNGKENEKRIHIYTHIHIHKIESLCCRAEINTTLKINYTSIKYFFNFLKLNRMPAMSENLNERTEQQ